MPHQDKMKGIIVGWIGRIVVHLQSDLMNENLCLRSVHHDEHRASPPDECYIFLTCLSLSCTLKEIALQNVSNVKLFTLLVLTCLS